MKKVFLKKQINKSFKNNSTTKFIRRLVFFVVDRSLSKFYKNDYSMKCLQSSVAVSQVLDYFGIKSRQITGAVCFSKVFANRASSYGWNGFWGDDHHVWVITEFKEVVDLIINKLHLHPATSDKGQLPIPALWWEDSLDWPCIIKYLPEGPIRLEFLATDENDLKDFKSVVKEEFEWVIKHLSVDRVIFEPILYGNKSFNELHESGNQWITESFKFQELNIPYPDWISAKEQELIKRYALNCQT